MNKYLCKFIDIFLKNNRERIFCAFLALFVMSVGGIKAEGQKRVSAYENYIKRYSGLAVEQCEKYGVPASITLAQGLLESGAGQSKLAREANNHFGIKCGNAWKGKSMRHDDDKKKECFRKYKRVEDSYEDHSLFLKRKRYEMLFEYKVTDYKSWAKGLRKCGYATDKKYAEKLIKIIEDYRLYRYDQEGYRGDAELVDYASLEGKACEEHGRTVYKRGKLKYVIAEEGDTYESIAGQMGMKTKKLLSLNEVENKEARLKKGMIVHVKKKQKKYAGKGKYYEVREGENVYVISQMLGVQMEQMLKRNKLDKNAKVMPGDRLKVK